MHKRIKLNEVLDALESMDGMYWYFDRETGEVVMVNDEDRYLVDDDMDDENVPDWQREQAELSRAIDEDEDGQRFLPLPDRHEVHEWDLMQQFAAGLEDEQASEMLLRAIRGGGAFRRFKDRIHELGVQAQWYEFRNAEFRQVAIDWCEANELKWVEQSEADASSGQA